MSWHQREDFAWEARDPRGNLRAIVTWDSQFSLYYVSAGEMEWEAFCSFSDAQTYVERGFV